MCFLGIVPALFPEEEKESILSQVGPEALKRGVSPAKEFVWQYFVNKSASHLHIVLGMSPVGDTLRTRCRNFPGALRLGLHIRAPPSAGCGLGERCMSWGSTGRVKHDTVTRWQSGPCSVR